MNEPLGYPTLAGIEPYGRLVAANTMYAVTFARVKLQHELDPFTERAWKSLKSLASKDGDRKGVLRCMRCNAIGTLEEWCLLLNSCCGTWEQYAHNLGPRHHDRLADMASPCTARAVNLTIEMLMLEGD